MTDENAKQPTGSARILVVDDEELVGGAVRRALMPPYDVVFLTSAQQALARISSGERFDLILCDLMMPKMSGMEFHGKLQAEAPEQAEKMIFLTGGAFTPAARAFLENVPNQRLEKPFDVDALLETVSGLLR